MKYNSKEVYVWTNVPIVKGVDGETFDMKKKIAGDGKRNGKERKYQKKAMIAMEKEILFMLLKPLKKIFKRAAK
ncbi:hypothetical protein CEXT_808811 [Caerostris extrusa]|uniref:Uncharacterized protein n=1 Tax=Caerostris extrusa TaxID=172846 RepID=A0AAV4PXT9_CAEEX|nr:hypothetical protein CEXT_808811 [Caerostris extrusa]